MALKEVDDWVTPPEGYDGPDDWVSPAPAPSKSSTTGAFVRGMERGALPAAGGVAGFAAGATAIQPVVAPLAAASGPFAPAVEVGGTFLGGAAGAFAGASAVEKAQRWVLDNAPQDVVKALGLDKEQEAADIEEHPIASFAGELAPNLAAFRPGAVVQSLDEGAPKIAKLLANPVTARAVPATVMGAQEAASEQLNEGEIDPSKVAIAAGVGALSNRETALGRKLTRAGAAPVEAVTSAVRNRISPMASPEEAAAPVLEAKSVDEAIAAASEVVNRPPMDIDAMAETARKQGQEALGEAEAVPTPADASRGLQAPAPAPEIPTQAPQSVRESPTYVEAKSKADTYARWLDELDEKRRQDAADSPKAAFFQHTIDAILGKVNGREEALTGKQAQRLAQARTDLDTLLNPEGDSPDMARVRAAMVAEHQKMADAVVAHRDQALKRAQDARQAAQALEEDLPDDTADQLASHMEQHGVDADTAVRDHIESQALAEVNSDHEQTGAYPEAQSLGGRQGQPDSGAGAGVTGRAAVAGDEGLAPEARQPAAQNPEPARELTPRPWEPLYDEDGAQIGWYDKAADEIHFGENHPDTTPAPPPAAGDMFDTSAETMFQAGEQGDIRHGRVVGTFTPEFDALRETVGADLRGRLEKMGLQDIALKLPDAITVITPEGETSVSGAYANKIIAVALEASPDGMSHTQVFDHEAVHAAQALGLFTKSEWSILVNRAARDWREKFSVDKRYPDLTEEKRNEEAIAEAYRAWVQDQATQKGTLASIFNKVRDTLAAIGNVFRGHGFQTADRVFQKLSEGKIGSRPRAPHPESEPKFQIQGKPEEGGVPMRAVYIKATGKVEFRPVAETKPQPAPPAAPKVLTSAPVAFKTAKGSAYEIHPDGTTTRNKAARPDAGHEGDSGLKPRSTKTVYLDNSELASALSAAGLHGLGDKGARVILKDGKASLLTWNEQHGKWGRAPSGTDIPFTTEPSIGKAPLELWKPANDIPGYEAYRGMHAGNEITSMEPLPGSVATTPEKAPRSLSLKPIEGTGAERERAINGDLYHVGEEAPQLEAAQALVEKDFDKAVAIAMRQKQPPAGIHPEFVYMAVEARAVRDGDVELQRRLSTSKIAEEATTMGQRIAAWRNRAEISPVDDMRRINEARAAKAKERGIEPEKAVETVVENGQQQIKAAAKSSKRPAWNDFIAALVCQS